MSRAEKRIASGGVQPRRRTVKWLTLIVATPLLLLSSYISAWLLFTWWVASGGALPPGRYTSFAVTRGGGVIVSHPAFEPIHRYVAAGWPGAVLLAALGNEVIQHSLPPLLPPPKPVSPVVEDVDRLLMDVPQ